MRTMVLPATAGLAITFATAAFGADTTLLTAVAGAGACGGDIHCFVQSSKTIAPATAADSAMATVGKTLTDGSYAHATATATFGAFHVYSDAYRVATSDAQSKAEADSVDFIPAIEIHNGLLNNIFVLNGSHTADDVFANSAGAIVTFQDYDVRTGARLDYGQFETTDAVPQPSYHDTVVVPVGDDVEAKVQIQTYTYSSFGTVDVADYANTLHIYLTSGPGAPDIIGVSGHDYAPNAVPEPATWAVMLVGFGLAGGALRRRAHFAARSS